VKILTYTDEDNYIRKSLVRDNDTSPEFGIPQDIPDLNELDWNEIKRELHNELTKAGIKTWKDIQQTGNLMSVVNKVIKRRLINLYKLEAKNG